MHPPGNKVKRKDAFPPISKTTFRISVSWEVDMENAIIIGNVKRQTALDNTGLHWSEPVAFYVTAEKHSIGLTAMSGKFLPAMSVAETNMLKGVAKTMFTALLDETNHETVIWGFDNNTAEVA